MAGAYRLSDVRAEKIEIICSGCNRHGVLSVAGLKSAYGSDIGLPDLRNKIATAAGCNKVQNIGDLDGCKARFSPESVKTWTKQGDEE